jgi:hypothetical protein
MSTTVNYRYYVHFIDGGEEGIAYFQRYHEAACHLQGLKTLYGMQATLWEEQKTIVSTKIEE